jgi:DNA-directed RNA polymerase specialized sigma24 family protein
MVNLYRMRLLIRQTVKVQWKLEQEQARATKITTVLTGMPRGGSVHDQVSDGAIKITELKEAYKDTIGELERMRAELDPLISNLERGDDRAIMRLRYIKGFSPEDIAEAIGRTPRYVYYHISQAENDLAEKFPETVKK